MTYRIVLTGRADDDLSRLDRAVAQRVKNGLERLAQHCDTLRHVALTGQHSGKFRLRIGNYRAVYRLDRENRLIEVESIGHRSNVY